MNITGVIKLIKTTEPIGSNGFQKRILIVTADEQYPQHIQVEFHQDKCKLLDNYTEGQQVEVGVNLLGKEWINPQGEAKYFNTIKGWQIKTV
jgi:hypothetical protein